MGGSCGEVEGYFPEAVVGEVAVTGAEGLVNRQYLPPPSLSSQDWEEGGAKRREEGMRGDGPKRVFVAGDGARTECERNPNVFVGVPASAGLRERLKTS